MKKSCPKCTKLFTSATYKYCYECNVDNKTIDFVDDKSDDDIDKLKDIAKCYYKLYLKQQEVVSNLSFMNFS